MKATGISIIAAIAILGTGAALASDGKERIQNRNEILGTYSYPGSVREGRSSADRIPDAKKAPRVRQENR